MSLSIFRILEPLRSVVGLLIVMFVVTGAYAQDDSTLGRTSTIRGTVKTTGEQPIVGARVKLQKTKRGSISNVNGEFRIDRVPVGHYVLTVTAPDYQGQTQDLVVTSAHQSVIEFRLEELHVQGDSLVVLGAPALAAVNTVAAVSVTPFSIEDVNRYAAAFQDPSRMAENFAGVYGRGSTNNYIVVRGGSPIELLWRLDDIEIPNPNHFGKGGSSGGLISAINSATLGNSDFLTGAFPAEYGTRLSAVFDLHTRDGNTERVENRVEASFNGLEALSEGPLPGLTNASYLASYRHSTLGVLREMGILDYENLPDFDDASLKLHLPIGQTDRVNLTGLWGYAHLNARNTTSEEIGSGSRILVGGADWQHLYSAEWLQHLYVNYVRNSYTEAMGSDRQPEENAVSYTTARTTVSFTPSASQAFEIGGSAQRGNYEITNVAGLGFDTTVHSNFYTAFLNWNWHIVPSLTINTGIFSQFISYDSSSSYEPRVSLAWSPAEEHSFSIAYGVHRQPEPLKLAEAKHYVAGYTYRPMEDLLIKAEGYLKRYSDIPVHASVRDAYSFQNEGYASRIDFSDLVNRGEGRTYGAELTVMKHYSMGYFLTGTASLVRQEFAGSDGIWHFGAFDNQYILNLVSGFDIALSNSSTLTLGEKFTFAGGGTYTPFDFTRSSMESGTVYDSSRVFGARNDPYVRLDINIDLHFNWQSSTLTIFGSVLNALSIKNVTYRNLWWDDFGQPFEHYDYDLPLLPILGIRYEF